VLGRPELHVCFGGSEKTVDDLIERALKICADPPEPFFPGEAAFSLDGYHLGFVQQLGIRDAHTFKAEYIKRYPDEIAQARLAISAHEQTGFANSLYWACANWGTKWRPSISTFDGVDERGRQRFYLETAWSPPVPVFEKIVALFPALVLDVYSSDEMGNYFIKGTISASGTELSDDKEAMAKWEAMMNDPLPF
jgi:hypothetical protein